MSAIAHGSLRVLLVEENPASVELVRALMHQHLEHATVLVARSAVEFAENLANGEIDFALCANDLSWSKAGDVLAAVRRAMTSCTTVLLLDPADTSPDASSRRGVYDYFCKKTSDGLVELSRFFDTAMPYRQHHAKAAPSGLALEHVEAQALPLAHLTISQSGEIIEHDSLTSDWLRGNVEDGESTRLTGRQFPDLIGDRHSRVRLRLALDEPGAVRALSTRLRALDDSQFQGWIGIVPSRTSHDNAGHPTGEPHNGGSRSERFDVIIANVTQATAERGRDDIRDEQGELYSALLLEEMLENIRLHNQLLHLFNDRYVSSITPDGTQLLEKLTSTGLHISETLRHLIDRMQPASESEGLVSVPMDQITDSVLSSLGHRLRDRSVRYEPGILPTLRASRYQLVQLFDAVLRTALRFTDDTATLLTIEANERPNDWLITVSLKPEPDVAPGPSQVVDFEGRDDAGKLGGRTTDDDEGGILMAVARRIAGRHGGDLWVSREAGGVRILITLSKYLGHTIEGQEYTPGSSAPASENGGP